VTANRDSYADAGVNIDLATNLLGQVKSKIAATKRPEVLAPVGGFGGLFQLDLSKYREPVLVASVDGVGTKLMVAAMCDTHGSVGHDIVNHCVNDIAVQGAEPLYFMDYIGIGKLRSPLYEQVLGGIADACAAQGMTLLGGETAEMPGMYGEDYDLVGSITGVVEKSKIITGASIRPGDTVLGIASNGPHTNGYSLARRVIFDRLGLTVDSTPPELGGQTVGEALLQPHTCYWPAIREAIARDLPIHGMAHITGGGWYDNIPRVFPDGVAAELDASKLPVPPIFSLIQAGGDVDPHEMYRVFNMGCGFMWILPDEAVYEAIGICRDHGFTAAPLGRIVEGDGTVTIAGID